MRRGRFLDAKKASLHIKESLSLFPVTIYLVSKQYHKVGTDEGVCPYFVALYPTEIITLLPL